MYRGIISLISISLLVALAKTSFADDVLHVFHMSALMSSRLDFKPHPQVVNKSGCWTKGMDSVLICVPEGPIKTLWHKQAVEFARFVKKPEIFFKDNDLYLGVSVLHSVVFEPYLSEPRIVASSNTTKLGLRGSRNIYLRIPYPYSEQRLKKWIKTKGKKQWVALMNGKYADAANSPKSQRRLTVTGDCTVDTTFRQDIWLKFGVRSAKPKKPSLARVNPGPSIDELLDKYSDSKMSKSKIKKLRKKLENLGFRFEKTKIKFHGFDFKMPCLAQRTHSSPDSPEFKSCIKLFRKMAKPIESNSDRMDEVGKFMDVIDNAKEAALRRFTKSKQLSSQQVAVFDNRGDIVVNNLSGSCRRASDSDSQLIKCKNTDDEERSLQIIRE